MTLQKNGIGRCIIGSDRTVWLEEGIPRDLDCIFNVYDEADVLESRDNVISSNKKKSNWEEESLHENLPLV